MGAEACLATPFMGAGATNGFVPAAGCAVGSGVTICAVTAGDAVLPVAGTIVTVGATDVALAVFNADLAFAPGPGGDGDLIPVFTGDTGPAGKLGVAGYPFVKVPLDISTDGSTIPVVGARTAGVATAATGAFLGPASETGQDVGRV